MHPHRIVSLLPAATEMVCHMGQGASLVGVSHECDHPPEVRALPRLTSSRLTAPGSGRAIDRSVRALLADALSLYELDLERLAGLRPTVVLTQDLCEVCAVPAADVEAALREVAGPVTMVRLGPQRLEDLFLDLRRLSVALGCEAAGAAAARGLKLRMEDLAARCGSSESPPSVLTLEWLDPPMLGGLWMPDLVERAGGTAIGMEAGQRARTVTREELERLDPDVVLVKPCGWDLAASCRRLDEIRDALPLASWRAVRSGRAFVADGSAYFNRPGPRLLQSLEILAAMLHPARFPELVARHAGSVLRLDTSGRAHPLLM